MTPVTDRADRLRRSLRRLGFDLKDGERRGRTELPREGLQCGRSGRPVWPSTWGRGGLDQGESAEEAGCVPIAAEVGRLYIQTMTRRTAVRRVDRETSGAIDFDTALEAYLNGGDPEDLRRAAFMVLGSTVPLNAELALVIAALTGCTCGLADYDDAGRAVRFWFALMDEDGARH